jgi:uncharacterized damage-inducible protein DinB
MSAGQADLLRYLRQAHDALVWKLDGLSEYDVRRPMTPTGTNLLGIVKHVATVQAGYLGDIFGRPFPEALPWLEDEEANADMWATADESRAYIVDLYDRVMVHSEETVQALGPDSIGRVPWWPEDRNPVTVHRILVHMLAEVNRHAGHADIIRELLDGAVGHRPDNDNMAEGDADWWAGYRDRLEQVAHDAG